MRPHGRPGSSIISDHQILIMIIYYLSYGLLSRRVPACAMPSALSNMSTRSLQLQLKTDEEGRIVLTADE